MRVTHLNLPKDHIGLTKLQGLQLKIGDLLPALVLKTGSEHALLLIKGKQVLAEVRTPLQAGDTLQVRVAGEFQNKVILKVLTELGTAQPSPVESLLRQVGGQSEGEARSALAFLLRNGLPVTSDTLRAVIRNQQQPLDQILSKIFAEMVSPDTDGQSTANPSGKGYAAEAAGPTPGDQAGQQTRSTNPGAEGPASQASASHADGTANRASASHADGTANRASASHADGTANRASASHADGTANRASASHADGTANRTSASSADGTANRGAASHADGTTNQVAASHADGTANRATASHSHDTAMRHPEHDVTENPKSTHPREPQKAGVELPSSGRDFSNALRDRGRATNDQTGTAPRPQNTKTPAQGELAQFLRQTGSPDHSDTNPSNRPGSGSGTLTAEAAARLIREAVRGMNEQAFRENRNERTATGGNPTPQGGGSGAVIRGGTAAQPYELAASTGERLVQLGLALNPERDAADLKAGLKELVRHLGLAPAAEAETAEAEKNNLTSHLPNPLGEEAKEGLHELADKMLGLRLRQLEENLLLHLEIPLFVQGRMTTAHLTIHEDAHRQTEAGEKPLRILFNLKTDLLGHLRIMALLEKQTIACQFSSDRETTRMLIRQTLPALQERFESISYQVNMLGVLPLVEEAPETRIEPLPGQVDFRV